VTRDPRAGCVDEDSAEAFPMPKEDVEGKTIVQVVQCFSDPNDGNKTVCPRCCQYPTKASVSVSFLAVGYVAFIQKSSSSSSLSPSDPSNALPPLPNMTTYCGGYKDLQPDSLSPSYDIDVIYADDADGALNWIVNGSAGNSSSPRFTIWDKEFFLLENFFNWVLIGVIATFSMTVSAYASGRISYQLYRQRLVARIRKFIKMRKEAQKDINNAQPEEGEEEDDSEQECSTPDVTVAVIAFVFISLFLVLIYFVKWIAVPIFLVIFAMSSLSLFTLTRPLIDRLPFGAKRVGCVMHCPCGWIRSCCGDRRTCCNWEVREILAAVLFLTLGWTWYFLRHDKIVILLLHNFLGFSLVYHVSNGIRVSRFQACVYPCVLLLIYDVFMVFITPFMTAGGMSVMESVARGTEGDDLPLVFKIPALFPTTENICSQREVAGLLGFGDVVLPAILASFMVLVGFVLQKPKLYIGVTFVSYPISLVATIVCLYLTQVAQPALLYIVPIMMIAIVITAAAAGDLRTLWKTDMMKYPKTIEPKHLALVVALQAAQAENGLPHSDTNGAASAVRGAEEDGEEEIEERTEEGANAAIDPAVPAGNAQESEETNQIASKDTSSLIHRNVGEKTESQS